MLPGKHLVSTDPQPSPPVCGRVPSMLLRLLHPPGSAGPSHRGSLERMGAPEQATGKVPAHQLAEVAKRRKKISQKCSTAISIQRGFRKKPFSLIAPRQLHHLPASVASYHKTRVSRNAFHLFLSVTTGHWDRINYFFFNSTF